MLVFYWCLRSIAARALVKYGSDLFIGAVDSRLLKVL